MYVHQSRIIPGLVVIHQLPNRQENTMEHFIIVTDPIDGVNFAQSPPAERTDACYMGYGPAVEAIPEVHAQRTFDWATDDAGTWADGMGVDHQVWHIVDGIVTEYMMVSY